MKRSETNLLRWLGGLFRRGPAGADVRYRVRNQTRQTEIGDQIELAGDSARRSRGLLGRTGLGRGQGLWIVPCESVHTFGMKFALDLIYIDRRNRVLKVRANVGRSRMSACLTAHSVIELPVGTVGATGTRRGDMLEFERMETEAPKS